MHLLNDFHSLTGHGSLIAKPCGCDISGEVSTESVKT